MNSKTHVHSESGKQTILISREFDLPIDLLFRAYTEAEIVEQWMGTKVVKLENQNHGGFHFITTDPAGNQHGFNGVIHEILPGQKITRTFEMENSTLPPQMEYLEFEKTSEVTSKLRMLMVFKSVEFRDQLLKMPFARGINMAHNRLQEIMKKQTI